MSKRMCDNHPDRLSIKLVRIYPYPDAPELLYMCTECLKEHEQAEKENAIDNCDWCGKEADKFHATKDIDEGLAGIYYKVCDPCYKKYQAQLRQELVD